MAVSEFDLSKCEVLPKVILQWLALLRNRKFPGPNLDPETGYPDLGILCEFAADYYTFRQNR